LWEEIHGAPIVDIKGVYGKNRLASYLAKYAAKEVAARAAYSWGWVWRGFARSWALVKKVGWKWGYTLDEVLTFWRRCVRLGYKPDEVMEACL
jgi:hypothetical protein